MIAPVNTLPPAPAPRPPASVAQAPSPSAASAPAPAPQVTVPVFPVGADAETEAAKGRAQDERSAAAVESLASQVEKANVRLRNTAVRFSLHDDTGTLLVSVVDRETDEIVRQIPPEELVDLRFAVEEMRGILLDSKG